MPVSCVLVCVCKSCRVVTTVCIAYDFFVKRLFDHYRFQADVYIYKHCFSEFNRDIMLMDDLFSASHYVFASVQQFDRLYIAVL